MAEEESVQQDENTSAPTPSMNAPNAVGPYIGAPAPSLMQIPTEPLASHRHGYVHGYGHGYGYGYGFQPVRNQPGADISYPRPHGHHASHAYQQFQQQQQAYQSRLHSYGLPSGFAPQYAQTSGTNYPAHARYHPQYALYGQPRLRVPHHRARPLLGHLPQGSQAAMPGDYMTARPFVAMAPPTLTYGGPAPINATSVQAHTRFPQGFSRSYHLTSPVSGQPIDADIEDGQAVVAKQPEQTHRPDSSSDSAMAQGLKFVNDFNAQFSDDNAAIREFHTLCKRFTNQTIEPTEFYMGVYKILHHGQALHMLPDFTAFLPPAWTDGDLQNITTQAKNAIQTDAQIEVQSGCKHVVSRNEMDQVMKQAVEFNVQKKQRERVMNEPMMQPDVTTLSMLKIEEEDKSGHKTSAIPDGLKGELQTYDQAPKQLPTAVMMPPPKQRKKRPVNAFTTDNYTNIEKPKDKPKVRRVVAGADEPSTPTPASRVGAADDPVYPRKINLAASRKRARETTPPESTAEPVKTSLSQNESAAGMNDKKVDLAVFPNESKSANPESMRMSITGPATKKKKTVVAVDAPDPTEDTLAVPITQDESPTLININSKSEIQKRYAKLSASEFLHFGPIFPTRRAILSRACKPYVHSACGARFIHPDDVRGHHRQICTGKARQTSTGWDAHPSCKVSYAMLNAMKCKDGYIVLDKESWDLIESCVQAGLQGVTMSDDGDEEEGDVEVEAEAEAEAEADDERDADGENAEAGGDERGEMDVDV